jgi:hypothetical protein
MGNNASTEENLQQVGYQVLGIQAHSPAVRGGLVSFFDFIVEANGEPIRSPVDSFPLLLKVLQFQWL